MNPNTAAIFHAVMAVLGAIAAASPSIFPAFVPSGVATEVIQTSGLLMLILSAVAGALQVTSPSTPGALGK